MTPPRPDPRPAREPKAVEAWALSDKHTGSWNAYWLFHDRSAKTVADYAPIPGYVVNPAHDRWIRVRIVPVKRRPRARRKA